MLEVPALPSGGGGRTLSILPASPAYGTVVGWWDWSSPGSTVTARVNGYDLGAVPGTTYRRLPGEGGLVGTGFDGRSRWTRNLGILPAPLLYVRGALTIHALIEHHAWNAHELGASRGDNVPQPAAATTMVGAHYKGHPFGCLVGCRDDLVSGFNQLYSLRFGAYGAAPWLAAQFTQRDATLTDRSVDLIDWVPVARAYLETFVREADGVTFRRLIDGVQVQAGILAAAPNAGASPGLFEIGGTRWSGGFYTWQGVVYDLQIIDGAASNADVLATAQAVGVR